ncbi:CAS1 appressorium specific protein [Blumeria hordei DH14]|uniref:CAS1 appressorium specific protein n=1 Tax=Blumeria graminis f. sp. hordei (strain DH14) TaxID=546991 RepID=N1JK13_BLUG1|nr:CAS1 appressorium specific protein [Blumeria hordei DH14]
MNTRLMLAGLAAIHLAAGYSIFSRQLNEARAVQNIKGDDTVPNTSGSNIRDGSVPRLNEVKSLLFTRDGAATLNNADNANNAENPENIDATNRDKQIPQVSKLVTGPDDKSITVDSHMIMMTVKANENGVGSYMCMIDSTGTGTSAGIWTEMEVTSKSTDKISPDGVADVEIQAAIDPNQKCTGRLDDKENVCVVRCSDAATPGSLEKSVYVQKAGEQNTPTPTDPNSDIQARATVAATHSGSFRVPSRRKRSDAVTVIGAQPSQWV